MGYPENVNSIDEKIEFVKSVYGINISNLFDMLIIDIHNNAINEVLLYCDGEGITEYDLKTNFLK
tara:strand:+ start:411 stop:605 length:195 start_codon:yes stop_codon:yes gene_type:complete